MIVTFFGVVSRSYKHSKETVSPVKVFSDEFHKNSVKMSILIPHLKNRVSVTKTKQLIFLEVVIAAHSVNDYQNTSTVCRKGAKLLTLYQVADISATLL
jgi:hypothetical protein